MTALAAAYNRQKRGTGKIVSVPVAASTKIWKGGQVAINTSGYAVPGASTTQFITMGVAGESVDNSAGADGALRVQVEFGAEFLFTATSVTQAMLGTPMYSVDDATVDDIDSDSIFVGIMTEYVSATSCWVFVPGPYEQSGGAAGFTLPTGDAKIVAGNLRLGAISAFATTEPTSWAVFKAGTQPSGAITTSGGIGANATTMQKIIAAGTINNIET